MPLLPVLPDSLTDALLDASEATCLALERGIERCVVRRTKGSFCPMLQVCWPGKPGLGMMLAVLVTMYVTMKCTVAT